MDRLDASLDDIIKSQRAAKMATKKKQQQKKNNTTLPPKTAKPIRTADLRRPSGKVGKASKAPYARPAAKEQKVEGGIFTETYKTLNAPIKEIFTAGYLPRTQPVKLVAINTNAAKNKQKSVAPISSQPIRLVVTQEKKVQEKPASHNNSNSNSNGNSKANDHGRTSTGPRISEPLSSLSARDRERKREHERERERERERGRGAYREADSYRPGRNDRYDSGPSSSHNSGRSNNRRESPPRREPAVDTARRNAPRDSAYSGTNTNNNSNSSNSNSSNSTTRMSDRLSRPEPKSAAPVVSRVPLELADPVAKDESEDMEIDDVLIRGTAPAVPDVTFRGESGPVTIEIENLDPGTTSEDVKFVCSRFGEIRTCICSGGFAQVTYARRAAGEAAVDGLHGKRADNGQILRVTMKKHAIIHDVTSPGVVHTPTPIAGPMALLHKAVNGTLANANTLYSDQLKAAQHMLKVQQHRMAQLQAEEQRIAALRLQAGQGATRF